MPLSDQKQRRTIKCQMDCTIIKEAISSKTLSKFTCALVLCWIVVGAILCGAFSEIEISEPRYDFRCDGTDDIDKDFPRGKCYDQYRLQNHKRGIAPYAFTLINVSLILFVTCIYSLCVKSKVDKLEGSHQDDDTECRDKRRSLFIAYICQLVNFALGITFFVLLETHIFYPKNFRKCSSVVTTIPYIESNFNGMTKHFAGCQSRPTKGRHFQQFCHSQIKSKDERLNAKCSTSQQSRK